MSRKLIGLMTGVVALLLLGAVWWSVVQTASAAPGEQAAPNEQASLRYAASPVPTAIPHREGLQSPDAPDISFIDSPTAQCYQPEQHKDTCYIQWQYMSVTASSGQYIISMTVDIDSRMRAYYSGFFQTSMTVPHEMQSPGFKVTCGTPGSGGNPNLGKAYSYTIRARETGGLKAANYGSVTCPADTVPPASIDLNGPTSGLPDVPYTYTASVNPITVTLPLTYAWQVSDQTSITVTGGLSNTQAFTWGTTGVKQVAVEAFNAAGTAVVSQTVTIANPTPTPTATPPPVVNNPSTVHLPLVVNGGTTGESAAPQSAQPGALVTFLRLLGLAP